MKRRSELRLIERAVNQGWAVPCDERRRSVEFVHSVLADPDATERETLRACRIVVAMERTNDGGRVRPSPQLREPEGGRVLSDA